MVRHIRRGYDGSDENPLVMRWTIPAALMYCITIYTTIGTIFKKSKPPRVFIPLPSGDWMCFGRVDGQLYGTLPVSYTVFIFR